VQGLDLGSRDFDVMTSTSRSIEVKGVFQEDGWTDDHSFFGLEESIDSLVPSQSTVDCVGVVKCPSKSLVRKVYIPKGGLAVPFECIS
jgi:hypothetical protein